MKYVRKLTLLLLLLGCNTEDEPITTGSTINNEWLISTSRVFDIVGKDAIPALENPQMSEIDGVNLEFMDDSDLVLVYESGGEVRAYAHPILDWHEIINDQIGDDYVAITYCPLTGTGIGWGRELNGSITTFGVSGFLYETNLMPYDRLTDSYWSQMFNQCVNGFLIRETPEFFNLVQMNYAALKVLYPNALITSNNTGHIRNYNTYPYDNYRTDSEILFPISRSDERLHPKAIVRGVEINGSAKAYPFPNSGNRELIVDEFNGEEIIVVADETKGFIVSFLNREIEGTLLNFSLLNNENSNIILEDQLGNKWDLFGKAIDGPNAGLQLEVPYSYIGYWFAWATFYPNITLFGME